MKRYCVDCRRFVPGDYAERSSQLQYAKCEAACGAYCGLKNPRGDCPDFEPREAPPEATGPTPATAPEPPPAEAPAWLAPLPRSLGERWMKLCMGW